MPLVRVNAPGADDRQLRAIGDVVHAAMVETLGVPEDDHFQVLSGAGTDHVVYDSSYLDVHRDDGIVVVQVFLGAGRSERQKRAFYRCVADHGPDAGIEARNLLLVLTENAAADWSFGDGEAQLLDHPPARLSPARDAEVQDTAAGTPS